MELYLKTTLISRAIDFIFIEIYKTFSQKRIAARLKQRQSVPEENPETQNLTHCGLKDTYPNQNRRPIMI